MMNLNKKHNLSNPYQKAYKRVLCVCSAGLLRSPTAAWVLSQDPFNYNTRAAGSDPEWALVPVTDELLEWADEVVFVNPDNYNRVAASFNLLLYHNKKVVLDIPDSYGYRDPKLVSEILEQYREKALVSENTG